MLYKNSNFEQAVSLELLKKLDARQSLTVTRPAIPLVAC